MKNLSVYFFSLLMMLSMASCAQKVKKSNNKKIKKDLSSLSQATFASGCFWCAEAESVKGVEEAVSGYAGGKEANPTYESVSAHTGLHAETVQVYYDPAVVSYASLLKVYFASQDPTQVNGQGPDHGESYRSIIFYRTTAEKMQAESELAGVATTLKA